MKRLFQRQRSRKQARVLPGYGAPHLDNQIANEQRLQAWRCRVAFKLAQPTIQFDTPIYKPE